jgi:hypothetical protein
MAQGLNAYALRMLHRDWVREGRLRNWRLLRRTFSGREDPAPITPLAPGQDRVRVQRHAEMVVTGSAPDDLIYLDHNATTPVAPRCCSNRFRGTNVCPLELGEPQELRTSQSADASLPWAFQFRASTDAQSTIPAATG